MIFSQKALGIQESFLNKWDSDIKYRIGKGEDVLQFNLGQPDFACPAFVQEAIAAVNGRERNNFYNHTGGTDAVREALAEEARELLGAEYAREETILTNGAKEALFLAFAALLNAGDEAIVVAPFWPTYLEQIRFLGAVPVIVEAGEDFGLEAAAIRKAVGPRTRLIVINNPNNPTGATYGREALAEIARLAAEKDLAVISDEVYNATVFDGKEHVSLAGFPGMKERAVIIDGFSKALSMTGYRLGYALAAQETIANMIKIKSDLNGNTNSFFQMVLEEVLLRRHAEFVQFLAFTREEYALRRDLLSAGLAEMGIEHHRPAGSFYVLARIPQKLGMGSREFAAYLLDRAGVAVAPGIFFGENYDDRFRFSFGSARADLSAGLERLRAVL